MTAPRGTESATGHPRLQGPPLPAPPAPQEARKQGQERTPQPRAQPSVSGAEGGRAPRAELALLPSPASRARQRQLTRRAPRARCPRKRPRTRALSVGGGARRAQQGHAHPRRVLPDAPEPRPVTLTRQRQPQGPSSAGLAARSIGHAGAQGARPRAADGSLDGAPPRDRGAGDLSGGGEGEKRRRQGRGQQGLPGSGSPGRAPTPARTFALD